MCIDVSNACRAALKLTFRKYTEIHTNYIISPAPLYNINIMYDTILRQKQNFKHER